MKIEIKDFYSPEVDEVWLWEPDDINEVSFLLEISIGEVGSDGCDIFQVSIVTPKGINLNKDFLISDRATIVIKSFDWEQIVSTLENVVKRCACSNWVDSVAKLQRFFLWEYEDYAYETVR